MTKPKKDKLGGIQLDPPIHVRFKQVKNDYTRWYCTVWAPMWDEVKYVVQMVGPERYRLLRPDKKLEGVFTSLEEVKLYLFEKGMG